MAADIFGVSGRAMMEALIAGERDPQALAALAKGRMRVKRAALRPTARFGDHGADFYVIRVNNHRKVRNLVHQLEVLLGRKVVLDPPA